jgi:YQGE family putative transporter
MIKRFYQEQKARFQIFSKGAKTMIWANLIMALFFPFYLIFANTFIFSNTKGDVELNLLYNIATFTGIISGFFFNGFLVRWQHVKFQMMTGSFLQLISTSVLFFMPPGSLSGYSILLFGYVTGIGNGFYWSSRNYMTVVNTNDNNRDFFAGLDYILASVGRITTPFLIGLYIGKGTQFGWFSSEFAYQSTLIFAFLIISFSSYFIYKEKYQTCKAGKFIYSSYGHKWNTARLMVTILAFFQTAMMVIPPVFIMKYIGNEAAVGSVNSGTYIFSMVIIYYISSRSKIHHRTRIMKMGAFILLFGALFFTVFMKISPIIAMLVLSVVLLLSDPILNFPFRASFMKIIDELKHIEKRDDYSYVFDIEFYTAIGRILSIAYFFLLYYFLSPEIAISIYVLTIALLQFLTLPLSKKINGV